MLALATNVKPRCDSKSARKAEGERNRAHHNEADRPNHVQIEPAPRQEFEAEIAIDQPRRAAAGGDHRDGVKNQSANCAGGIRASARGWRRLNSRKTPNPMTSRLAVIWICRCHSTSINKSANGRMTTSVASRWPSHSGNSAASSARELLSISPAETASGHPIPG